VTLIGISKSLQLKILQSICYFFGGIGLPVSFLSIFATSGTFSGSIASTLGGNLILGGIGWWVAEETVMITVAIRVVIVWVFPFGWLKICAYAGFEPD
jgi:hypothetical protein